MTDERAQEYMRQATKARERALLADTTQKSEWLKIAELWENLAHEYAAFRKLQSDVAHLPDSRGYGSL